MWLKLLKKGAENAEYPGLIHEWRAQATVMNQKSYRVFVLLKSKLSFNDEQSAFFWSS